MTTAEAAIRNPYQEREAIRADIQAARVALDTARGEEAKARAEGNAADGHLFAAEMDLTVNTPGAQKRRDEARGRSQAATEAVERYGRIVEAAGAVGKLRQSQLAALYDSDEAYAAFVVEAESATAGAISDMRRVQRALAAAASSWARATALWRPLNGPIRKRLEALNEADGRYPDTAREAVVLPFPIALPSDIETLAPRPSGIDRLRTSS